MSRCASCRVSPEYLRCSWSSPSSAWSEPPSLPATWTLGVPPTSLWQFGVFLLHQDHPCGMSHYACRAEHLAFAPKRTLTFLPELSPTLIPVPWAQPARQPWLGFPSLEPESVFGLNSRTITGFPWSVCLLCLPFNAWIISHNFFSGSQLFHVFCLVFCLQLFISPMAKSVSQLTCYVYTHACVTSARMKTQKGLSCSFPASITPQR